MPHDTPLISTIVVALVMAFVFGVLAQRLRFSPIVGYLIAGILISPFTPGYVADQGIANELAEIGVILLMFGVEGGQVVEQARRLNPALAIIARAHSEDEIEHLKKHGATSVVMGEHEIAKAMIADIPSKRG